MLRQDDNLDNDLGERGCVYRMESRRGCQARVVERNPVPFHELDVLSTGGSPLCITEQACGGWHVGIDRLLEDGCD